MRAFITGASEGIGGATCRLLARRAAQAGEELKLALVASGRKPAPQALLDELADLGANVQFCTGDISNAQSATDMAREAVAFCDGLDLFVSNAGGVSPGALVQLPIEVWDQQFNLNVRATFILAQAVYPALKQSNGALVAVASMSGVQAHPGQGAYSPAKAALISLCQNLAQEWAVDGVRVNTVSPGMVHTPLTERVYANSEVSAAREALVPLGRIGKPQDIAEAIVFLGSNRAGYITGQNVLIDGGISDSILGKIPGLRS